MLPDPAHPGESDLSRAFGADVRTELAGVGTFLVVGREADPSGLVRGAGGQVLVAFDARRLLAVLPVQAGLALQRHPQVELCGPVSVDFERLRTALGHVPVRTAKTQQKGEQRR